MGGTELCSANLKAVVDAGAAVPSCAAIAAWFTTDLQKPSCADPAVAGPVVLPTGANIVYGTGCTAAIYDVCIARAWCTEFVYDGKFKVPAASSTTDSSKSPAAMISAGIAPSRSCSKCRSR